VSADILSDPTFQHGTVEGFTDGCRGAHCPSQVACREVHRRHKGDYAFRKAMDSGLTAAQVVAAETAAAEEARRAAAAARAALRQNGAQKTRPKPKLLHPRTPSTDYQKQIAELVTVKGLTDKQVGAALGRTREQAASARKYLGLPANHERKQPPVATGGFSS
jgi:hypothetical protein